MKWVLSFVILIYSFSTFAFQFQNFECTPARSRAPDTCPISICKGPNNSQALAYPIGRHGAGTWINLLPLTQEPGQRPVLGEIQLASLNSEQTELTSEILPSVQVATGAFPSEYKDSFVTYQMLSTKGYTSARDETVAERCDDPDLTSLIEKINQHRDHLNNAIKNHDYVKIIDLINGSNVFSRMVPRSEAQGYCQLGSHSYASESALNLLEQTRLREPRGKVLAEDEAKKVFAELKNMKDLPWGFTPDGCYARAQIAAERLEKKGIAVGKAWYFGDDLWPKNKEKGELDSWRYHVAPFVYVRGSDGKIRRMTLDPATQSGPIETFEFGKTLTRQENVQVVQTRWAGGANQTGLPYIQMILTNVDYYDPSVVQVTPRRSNRQDAEQTNRHYNEMLQYQQNQSKRRTQ